MVSDACFVSGLRGFHFRRRSYFLLRILLSFHFSAVSRSVDCSSDFRCLLVWPYRFGWRVHVNHLKRQEAMEDIEIASLAFGSAAIPLNVRVLRKWKPSGRHNEICCLFVDKQGVAIQAVATNSEIRHVDNSLSVGSCYTIDNYGCAKVDPFTNVLNHCTHLSIGMSSSFNPIPDTNEIPREYFDFASRSRMLSVCDKEYQVIDYIGYVQKIEHFQTKEKRPYVVISIRDCSNKDIKITLWEEICTRPDRYNKHVIESAPDPRIVAATSVKVKNFQGQIKLQSSTATYVYLHPLSIETHLLLDLYHNGRDAILALDDGDIMEDPTITLSEMMAKPAEQINGQTFNIIGHIMYIPIQEWCHVACQSCNKDTTPAGPKWYCSRHGLNDTPRYVYRVNCVIRDLSGTINATLYDEGITTLIGQPCQAIVENDQHIDISNNPALMEKVILKESKFRVKPTKNPRSGATRCTCDRVEPLQPLAAIEEDIQITNALITSQTTTIISSIEGEGSMSATNTTKAFEKVKVDYRETSTISKQPIQINIESESSKSAVLTTNIYETAEIKHHTTQQSDKKHKIHTSQPLVILKQSSQTQQQTHDKTNNKTPKKQEPSSSAHQSYDNKKTKEKSQLHTSVMPVTPHKEITASEHTVITNSVPAKKMGKNIDEPTAEMQPVSTLPSTKTQAIMLPAPNTPQKTVTVKRPVITTTANQSTNKPLDATTKKQKND
ncbi:hypothetical protein QVD17_30208 [Tagetes erecta]|uniref:Replication factor A C-terminal domain-containing protein n=1 Tax=Tagetes erecta TaxID=13708 RepID=A0AAD8K2B4_TARER|nr:hypothetical protein QVD17_30208 [Tagetes erecta]